MDRAQLLEQLETLAETPEAIPKLHALVFDLAIRGRLLPQNQSDEPASSLLEKLSKQKGTAENNSPPRAKQTRDLPEFAEPFALPESWEWTTLGVVSLRIHYGYTASAIHGETGVRLLRITDIQNGRVNWDSVPGCQITNAEIPKYQLNDNDVLIARTGGTIGKSFLVRKLPVTAVFASYLIRVIPSDLFSADYLSVFLRSSLYWEQLRESSAGTGQPNVNGEALSQLAMSVPPFAEQRRIVAKVEELLASCDELGARQTAAREHRTRLVRSALDRLTNANGRRPSPVAATSARVTISANSDAPVLRHAVAPEDGRTPGDFGRHAAFVLREFPQLTAAPEDIPALRQAILSLAVQGRLVPQSSKDEPGEALLARIRSSKRSIAESSGAKRPKDWPPVEEDELSFPLPKGWASTRLGDLAINIEAGSSPQCEGRPKRNDEWGVLKISAVSWDEFDPGQNKALPANVEPRREYEVQDGDFIISRANTAELVAKSVITNKPPPKLLLNDKTLRVLFTEWSNKRFLNMENNSSVSRTYYARIASGTSSSMKNVSRESISMLPIALPPLAEQQRIVAKVDELMRWCDALEARLTAAQTTATHLLDATLNQILTA